MLSDQHFSVGTLASICQTILGDIIPPNFLHAKIIADLAISKDYELINIYTVIYLYIQSEDKYDFKR